MCGRHDHVREPEDLRRRETPPHRVQHPRRAIVRWIFGAYVLGRCLKRIARDLNSRAVPSPQAGLRGTGSWSTWVIRPLLKRERYRGVIAWGEFEKTYALGTQVRVRRAADDADRVRVEVPELRIVDDELWFAAQARFTRRGVQKGKDGGRMPRHLGSGIGRCAQHVQNAGKGEKEVAAQERQAAKTRREIDRLVDALALSDDKPDAIVKGIAERQGRLRDLEAKIAAAKAAPQVLEDTLTRVLDASPGRHPPLPRDPPGTSRPSSRSRHQPLRQGHLHPSRDCRRPPLPARRYGRDWPPARS